MNLELIEVSIGLLATVIILREVFNFLFRYKAKETEISVITKLDQVLDKITMTSEKVAVIEAVMQEHKNNIERFWTKDWPEVMSKIKDLERETDSLKETVIRLKTVIGKKLDEAG